MLEAGANRLWSHRLQPKPPRRFLRARPPQRVTENELAFAPGITGVNDLGHIGPLDQTLEYLQSRFCLLFRDKIEMVRQHWEIFDIPFPAFHFCAFRWNHLDQMTNRRGDHILIVLEEIFLVLELA